MIISRRNAARGRGCLVAAAVCALGLVFAPVSGAAQSAAALRSVVLCVRDAMSDAPLFYARTHVVATAAVEPQRAQERVQSSACGTIVFSPQDTLVIRRLGYRTSRFAADQLIAASVDDTVHLSLASVASTLAPSITRASRCGGLRDGGGDSSNCRAGTTVSSAQARTLGVSSTGGLVALLPYAFPRGRRGDAGVSLRGARQEQVVVTLDGLPLNDPATGLADLADVPLLALGGATVLPGSDPLGAGPGAVGGVLALESGAGSLLSARAGTFGARAVEGAWSRAMAGASLRVGAAYSTAHNNFAFVNAASTSGTIQREQRVNNDVSRGSLLAQWQSTRFQLLAIAARAEMGLVGPVNVRQYDADRSQTDRLLLRGASHVAGALVSAGVRMFGVSYHDPLRPVFDSKARAQSADLDARRTIGGTLVRVGGGFDALRADAEVSQDRARGFVSATRAKEWASLHWTGGARIDAVGGSGVLPSMSIAARYEGPRAQVGVQLAQAVRVPTLYDLYFSSPQRLTVTALRAERVTLDAELNGRWRAPVAAGVISSFDASLVSRTTRNAIVWFPGNFGWSPANVGTEELRGVEARGAFTHARGSLSAWGTIYRAELQSGAIRIPTPYVPTRAGGALAQLTHRAMSAGVAARWLGERPFTAGPRDPAFMLPGVGLVDLSVSAARQSRGMDLLLALSLENATNRAWQSTRGYPAPGRSWSLALTLRP